MGILTKKQTTLLTPIFLLILILALSGCDSDDQVAATLQGDEKLGEETVVPLYLSQNYPNPFNPLTTFQIGAARDMHVVVRIYTEEWQESSVVFDRTISPGLYTVRFNAIDLPSGVYYYVAEGGGYKQIRAMRLTK